MLIVKVIESNTVYAVQELHLCLFSSSDKVILASITFLTVSVHFSTNINYFFSALTVFIV